MTFEVEKRNKNGGESGVERDLDHFEVRLRQNIEIENMNLEKWLRSYSNGLITYDQLIAAFSATLSTECEDGTHHCVPEATCLQSTKSAGYLCLCGSGTYGNCL